MNDITEARNRATGALRQTLVELFGMGRTLQATHTAIDSTSGRVLDQHTETGSSEHLINHMSDHVASRAGGDAGKVRDGVKRAYDTHVKTEKTRTSPIGAYKHGTLVNHEDGGTVKHHVQFSYA